MKKTMIMLLKLILKIKKLIVILINILQCIILYSLNIVHKKYKAIILF